MALHVLTLSNLVSQRLIALLLPSLPPTGAQGSHPAIALQSPPPAVHIQVMKDPSQPPWSNNPNGPRISHLLYTWEKAFLAGGLMGATL